MTTIVTRQGKGSPLSTVEMDNNLTNLNNDKVEKVNPTTSGTLTHTGDVSVSGKSVSNTLYANAYQSNVSNAGTDFSVVPNGTGNYTALNLSASVTGNTPIAKVVQTATSTYITADKMGTGSYTPISIFTSGVERFRISTSGAWALEGNYGSAGQFLMSNGSSSSPTWNTVDLTTKVSKSGDTMTGLLTVPGLALTGATQSIYFNDTTTGHTRYIYQDDDSLGFLDTTGNWEFRTENNGHIWTKAYGLLTDYFSAIGHTHNYAGVNSKFDWELVRNATIATNATLNVLSNYGYGIYYYTTSGASGILITCNNGATFNMGIDGTSMSVNAADILSNSVTGSRTLYLYKLRKTA